jgi:hypothetical protein
MSVTEVIRPKAKGKLGHVRMLIDGSRVDSLSGVTLEGMLDSFTQRENVIVNLDTTPRQ